MSQLLTVRETAERLRFSQSAVYRALEDGKLPGYKVLGRWRVDVDELEAWMREHRPQHAPSDQMPPASRRRRERRFASKVVDLETRRASA